MRTNPSHGGPARYARGCYGDRHRQRQHRLTATRPAKRRARQLGIWLDLLGQPAKGIVQVSLGIAHEASAPSSRISLSVSSARDSSDLTVPGRHPRRSAVSRSERSL
jgi:hypothetical protein